MNESPIDYRIADQLRVGGLQGLRQHVGVRLQEAVPRNFLGIRY
jgi:hypothetical protein